MFQFGEVLTLFIGLVLLIYVVMSWRRIRADPMLAPLIPAVLLFVAAWVFTVVEGLFIQPRPEFLFVISQGNLGPHETLGSRICNTLEHFSFAAGGIAFLYAVIRLRLGWQREGRP